MRKLARGAGARVISKLFVFFIKSKPDQVLGPGPWGRLRGPSRRLVPSWGYPGAGRPGPSAWGRASWPLRARSAAAEPPPRRIAVLARAVPALPVTPLLGRRLRAPAPRDAPNQTSVCLPACLSQIISTPRSCNTVMVGPGASNTARSMCHLPGVAPAPRTHPVGPQEPRTGLARIPSKNNFPSKICPIPNGISTKPGPN